MGSIPGSGRFPGEGNGNPLQYSCLKNSMRREAWHATVHGTAKSCAWIKWLNTHTHMSKLCQLLPLTLRLSLERSLFITVVVQLLCRVWLCNPVDCSMPGSPTGERNSQYAQNSHKMYVTLSTLKTHVHWIGVAIHPTHPLLLRSPPALNLSQHQSLFQ